MRTHSWGRAQALQLPRSRQAVQGRCRPNSRFYPFWATLGTPPHSFAAPPTALGRACRACVSRCAVKANWLKKLCVSTPQTSVYSYRLLRLGLSVDTSSRSVSSRSGSASWSESSSSSLPSSVPRVEPSSASLSLSSSSPDPSSSPATVWSLGGGSEHLHWLRSSTVSGDTLARGSSCP